MSTNQSTTAARRCSALLRIATTLAIVGCSATEIVHVETPDIVDPSDVESASGANAVRVGALTRLNFATTGDESLFLLGGLFADEWNNGDSFIARQEIDRRAITPENTFLLAANRVSHRARLAAQEAVRLLDHWVPTAPGWQVAEMYFVQAYVINTLAEHYCDGIVFSNVVDGREEYGSPIMATAAFEQALQLTADGLARITGTTTNDVRVQNALRITRGRILLNLNRITDAATAVAAVPTNFTYTMQHSANTQSNTIWLLANNARRFSVSDGEGGNGLNFGSANDPRVPVCTGGDATCRAIGVTQTIRDDLTQPLLVQRLWPARESAVAILLGVEARMMEAEAQLRADEDAQALATINAARATLTGLAPLDDAGSPEARVDQLFRERAFWLFSRGTRVGDMRRLIRQYGRAANTVFPTGAWHKAGGAYSTDVNFPVPQQEANNPNVSKDATCINRNP